MCQLVVSFRFGLCFFQAAACSSRVAEAIVRSWPSFGSSPCAMRSSIAGSSLANSRRRRMVRTGIDSAVPTPSSV